jgi:hypothetical protein
MKNLFNFIFCPKKVKNGLKLRKNWVSGGYTKISILKNVCFGKPVKIKNWDKKI